VIFELKTKQILEKNKALSAFKSTNGGSDTSNHMPAALGFFEFQSVAV